MTQDSQTGRADYGGALSTLSCMRRFITFTVLAGIVLLMTACSSGGGSTDVTGLTRYQQELAFSQCMRSHGVLDYPDPSGNGEITINGNLSVSSSVSQSAENACRRLMPKKPTTPAQQEQALSEALKFSECMRSHGVPDFPDPGSQQNSAPKMDKKSPVFQAAQRACQQFLPTPGGS